jgi:hypothetical protein
LRSDIITPIGGIGLEELFNTLNGDCFDHVAELTAVVVSFAGISLRVFIGQRGGRCLEDGFRHVIFGCYQDKAILLTRVFSLEDIIYLGIRALNRKIFVFAHNVLRKDVNFRNIFNLDKHQRVN